MIQRVASASVEVQSSVVGQIGQGLLVFACAMQDDVEDAPVKAAAKVSKLRIFGDEQGRMNRSVVDVRGSLLVVSQFTLAADISRGNRPGFSTAAGPELGRRLFDLFVSECRKHCDHVELGKFGAEMSVKLENDGPVTIWMEVD